MTRFRRKASASPTRQQGMGVPFPFLAGASGSYSRNGSLAILAVLVVLIWDGGARPDAQPGRIFAQDAAARDDTSAAESPDPARVQVASPYERLLREHGIEPSAAGLLEFLRALQPTSQQQERYQRLIEQLGSDNFATREAASRMLTALPSPPDALHTAAISADPEVRWRARRIVESSDHPAVLFAVLKSIEHLHTAAGDRVVERFVPALLAAVPLCDRPHLARAVASALRVSARDDDVDRLRRALMDSLPEVRSAAAAALPAVLGEHAADDVAKLLGEPRQPDPVRLAAAESLADLGDRRALPALVDLLESEDVQIRLESSTTLRQLTGQASPFVAYADSGSRAPAVDQWRVWLETHGATAELRFPVPRSDWGESFLGGNRLVATGYQNKVIELTPDGREVWAHEVRHAFSAEKLPSGHVLIAAYGANKVLEVDASGQVVWECGVPSCLNARLLPNGNILVAGHTSKKVLELTREKDIVWELELSQNCYDAHRLPNGNALLALGQRIEEISPDGKTVWAYEAKGSIYGIQPLPSGNVLLTDTSQGVVEMTREGKPVWKFGETNAFDAFRLPDGNTLVSSNRRFIEVTPEGKIVWELAGGGYGRARR